MNDILTGFGNLFAPPRHLILLVAGAWIGLTLSEKRAVRRGARIGDINNLSTYGLVAFLLGGRISFVLQNISAFTQSPWGILSINPDLIDPLGGAAAVAITAFVYVRRNSLPIWIILDSFTPFLALGMVAISLSRFAAGTAFGVETDLPWGVVQWNATRHPTQLYDFLLASLTAILIWRMNGSRTPGIEFLTFTAITAATDLFVEFFRAESTPAFWGIRQEQLIGWFILAATIVLMEHRFSQEPKNEAGHWST